MTICDMSEGERATPLQPTTWLTAQGVADQLHLGVKLIYRAVKRGKLRAAIVDGRYRIRQEWVDAWTEACSTRQ